MIKEEKIVQLILKDLINGLYDSGSFLAPERALAAQYNCSRPVVHRALIRLETMGLVDILPRKGVKVKDYRMHGKLSLLSYVMHLDKELIDEKMKMDLLGFMTDIIRHIVLSLKQIQPHYLVLETPEDYYDLFHYYSRLNENQLYTYLLNEFKVGMINVFYYVVDDLNFYHHLLLMDENLVKGHHKEAVKHIDGLIHVVKNRWLGGIHV